MAARTPYVPKYGTQSWGKTPTPAGRGARAPPPPTLRTPASAPRTSTVRLDGASSVVRQALFQVRNGSAGARDDMAGGSTALASRRDDGFPGRLAELYVPGSGRDSGNGLVSAGSGSGSGSRARGNVSSESLLSPLRSPDAGAQPVLVESRKVSVLPVSPDQRERQMRYRAELEEQIREREAERARAQLESRERARVAAPSGSFAFGARSGGGGGGGEPHRDLTGAVRADLSRISPPERPTSERARPTWFESPERARASSPPPTFSQPHPRISRAGADVLADARAGGLDANRSATLRAEHLRHEVADSYRKRTTFLDGGALASPDETARRQRALEHQAELAEQIREREAKIAAERERDAEDDAREAERIRLETRELFDRNQQEKALAGLGPPDGAHGRDAAALSDEGARLGLRVAPSSGMGAAAGPVSFATFESMPPESKDAVREQQRLQHKAELKAQMDEQRARRESELRREEEADRLAEAKFERQRADAARAAAQADASHRAALDAVSRASEQAQADAIERERERERATAQARAEEQWASQAAARATPRGRENVLASHAPDDQRGDRRSPSPAMSPPNELPRTAPVSALRPHERPRPLPTERMGAAAPFHSAPVARSLLSRPRTLSATTLTGAELNRIEDASRLADGGDDEVRRTMSELRALRREIHDEDVERRARGTSGADMVRLQSYERGLAQALSRAGAPPGRARHTPVIPMYARDRGDLGLSLSASFGTPSAGGTVPGGPLDLMTRGLEDDLRAYRAAGTY